jgi:uncharacterized protein with von Willebrand factor type A (vWA) domain
MTDPFADLFAIVRSLHERGVMPGVDRVAAAARALATIPTRPYLALRLTLCSSASELQTFDDVWYGRTPARISGKDDRSIAVDSDPDLGGGQPRAANNDGDGSESATKAAAGSRGVAVADSLTRRDLAHLTEADRDEIRRLIALLAPVTRLRPVMRRARARTGRVDPGRAMRLMLRNDGEPSPLPRTKRARRPRRLLLLIDISASMLEYRDAYLRFAHAAVAAGPKLTEVFSIGARCTRLTPLLAGSADGAMAALAALENDWYATTLGRSLHQLRHGWSGRAVLRGAIVVIFSDGEESDGPQLLPREVAHLARLGHRLLWINPLKETEYYEPFDALADSLRHTSMHLPGHNVEALRQLTEVIAT